MEKTTVEITQKQIRYVQLERSIRAFKDTEDAHLIPEYQKSKMKLAKELGDKTPTDIQEKRLGTGWTAVYRVGYDKYDVYGGKKVHG